MITKACQISMTTYGRHSDPKMVGQLTSEPYSSDSINLVVSPGRLLNVSLDELEEFVKRARKQCEDTPWA